MSGRAVKVSLELLESARREAELMSRSVARQIEHWATLGRSIEGSGHFSTRRIAEFLEGRASFDSLNSLEGTVATDRLIESLEETRAGPSFLESLQRTGVPCSGVIEGTGEVVRVHPDGRIETVHSAD